MTKEELKLRAFEIIDNAKKELRELSEDEAKEIYSIKAEIKSLDEDEKVDEETKSEDTTPEDELDEKELDGNKSTPEEELDEDETSEEDDEVSKDKEEADQCFHKGNASVHGQTSIHGHGDRSFEDTDRTAENKGINQL